MIGSRQMKYTMKRLPLYSAYLMGAALLTAPTPVSAAPAQPVRKATAQDKFKQLIAELDLDENQQRLLAVGLKNYLSKLAAVRADAKLTQRKKLESIAKIIGYIDAEFKTHLSSAQYREYEGLREKLFQTPQAAQGPGAKLAKELGLTLQQQLALAPVFQQQMAQIKAIRANPRLNGAQKLQAFQAVQAAITAAMRKNLTAEQFKKWQEMAVSQKKGRFPRK